MMDSSKEGSGGSEPGQDTLKVPSPTFFGDIKFYISGNVSDQVSS